MAVQTPGSITSEALARLTDLHFNERESKLKAERASAMKSIEGRQILPGVMAQLAELEQKKAQQKAKIAKQAEDQGVSQKSLLPPMIDVTGQTSGRSPQAALTAASEIAKQVSGGAGIKQGQIGGIFGQQAPPQQAPMQNAPSANQGVPAQTSPAGQPAGEGFGTRLGRAGLNILGNRLGGVALGNELIPRPPEPVDVWRQADKFAPSFGILEARRRSSDPTIAAEAGRLYDQKMGELEQMNPDLAAAARIKGENYWLEEEEKQRLKAEDPKERDSRMRAELRMHYIEKEMTGSLDEEDRRIMEVAGIGPKKQKLDVTGGINLTQATESVVQQQVEVNRGTLQSLQGIQAAIADYPEFFESTAGLEYESLRLRARNARVLGTTPLSPKETQQMLRYSAAKIAFAAFNLEELKAGAGKAMTKMELELVLAGAPRPDMAYDEAKQAAALMIERIGLSNFRKEALLKNGFEDDPDKIPYAKTWGQTKEMVRAAANATADAFEKQGMLPEEAKDATYTHFQNKWALDLKRMYEVSNGTD